MNASAGSGAEDTIDFGIPTSDPGYQAATGSFLIEPAAPLPVITTPVIIDGYSQPGAAWNTAATSDNARLLIELNGSLAGASNGLEISGGGSVVQGLDINGFSGNGIQIEGAGDNVIAGNFIGTDITGTVAQPNGNGIAILSADNLVGNNAQLSDGTAGMDGSDANAVNNLIASDSDLAGAGFAGALNVVSGNEGGYGPGAGGVGITASNNVVAGNFIGPDATSTRALGNYTGVSLAGANNLVGGTDAQSQNVISGNSGAIPIYTYTVDVRLWGASGNEVAGNLIGTNAAGTAALNTESDIGVLLYYGTNDSNTIEQNVISSHTVRGFRWPMARKTTIWLRPTKSARTPRERFLWATASTAWGSSPTAQSNQIIGNTIAFNGSVGIAVVDNGGAQGTFSATGNTIEENSIHDNGGLGIDLGGSLSVNSFGAPPEVALAGVIPNDASQAQGLTPGPNDLQNYPVFSVAQDGSMTYATGTLASVPDTTFTLDFYANSQTDPSGYGEGETWLGSISVTTNDSGNATFSTFNGTLLLGAPFAALDADFTNALASGDSITATATNTTTGDTSEFSAAVPYLTTTSLADSANPSNYGQPVTLTATVATSVAGVVPTGTVTFEDNGVALPGSSTVARLLERRLFRSRRSVSAATRSRRSTAATSVSLRARPLPMPTRCWQSAQRRPS